MIAGTSQDNESVDVDIIEGGNFRGTRKSKFMQNKMKLGSNQMVLDELI